MEYLQTLHIRHYELDFCSLKLRVYKGPLYTRSIAKIAEHYRMFVVGRMLVFCEATGASPLLVLLKCGVVRENP